MRNLAYGLSLLTVVMACDTGQSFSTTYAPTAGSPGSGNGGSGGHGNAPVAGSGGILGDILSGGVFGGGGNASTHSDAGDVATNGGASSVMNPDQLPRVVQYIRASPYSRLVFEVDSVAGMEQRPDVATRIVQRFSQILDKPDGVEVVNDDTLPAKGGDFAWGQSDLDEVAASFDGDPDAHTLAIHVAYVDGHSASDSDSGVILGVSWGNLQVVMFKQTIESSCSGLGLIGPLREKACAEAEFGILTHELGHVLGLVNNGLPMVDDHQDPDHSAHDISQNCIMFWAYQGQGLSDAIGSRLLANQQASLTFCQHCLDDIAAAK